MSHSYLLFAVFFSSTVSSSINALVAVTVEDFIIPHFKGLSEKQLKWLNMGLSKFCDIHSALREQRVSIREAFA